MVRVWVRVGLHGSRTPRDGGFLRIRPPNPFAGQVCVLAPSRWGPLRAPNLILRKHPEENGPGMSLRMSPPRPTCPIGGPSHPWREDGQCRSAWGRLAPDSQRRGLGPGDDCGNPSARMPSAGSVPGRCGRASDLQNRLFSWEVKGRFLVFHVKLFFRKQAFSVRIVSGI
jgi:hypothetical protein